MSLIVTGFILPRVQSTHCCWSTHWIFAACLIMVNINQFLCHSVLLISRVELSAVQAQNENCYRI